MVPALNAEVIVAKCAGSMACVHAGMLALRRACCMASALLLRRPWMGGAGILQTKIFQTFRYFR